MIISKTRHLITWLFTIFMALAFMLIGYLKITGHPEMVYVFTHFGLPDWFRTLIGILDVIGGVLLLLPRFTGMAAFGLSVLMLGAALGHIIHDPVVTAIPAMLFFCTLTFIYLTRRNIVPVFLQKHLLDKY